MKAIALLIVFLLIPLAYANEPLVYSADSLEIGIKISSGIEILPRKPDYSAEYVSAEVYLFPEDGFQQKVKSIEMLPNGVKKDDLIEFTWESPSEKNLWFLVSSEVETRSRIKEVKTKVDFPLSISYHKEYTQETENIDISNDIIFTASGIAEGEDDLYAVVHRLGEWVKRNMEYDLAYADLSEKPSKTIVERRGTCDEFTSLFISMCRSLGIPARYVSGIAYSNIPEIQGFGPHAWAEVYFPGYGWVAFDVTYGEFGRIGVSHVALGVSEDSGSHSTRYRWRGRDFDIRADRLDISAEIIKAGEKIPELADASLGFYADETGFGSYNIIAAEIRNPNNYYLPLAIQVSVPREVEVFGHRLQYVLLKPYEQKEVYWKVRLDDSLRPGYIYTMPAGIYVSGEPYAESSMASRQGSIVLSEKTVDDILSHKLSRDEKKYLVETLIECRPESDSYYVNDEVSAVCSVKNLGNTLLKSLSICFMESCSVFDLGISQEKELVLSGIAESTGEKQKTVTLRNDDVSEIAHIRYEVIDDPELLIESIEHPESVAFGQDYKAEIVLKQVSYSVPRDAEVLLRKNGIIQRWSIGDVEGEKRVSLILNSKGLSEGQNRIIAEIRHYESSFNEYLSTAEFFIEMEKMSFFQKIESFFSRIGLWLESLLS